MADFQETLTADKFTTFDVPIVSEWPAAFSSAGSEAVHMDKTQAFDLMFKGFSGYAGMKIDADVKLADYDKPSDVYALASYCTSKLWKDRVAGSNSKQALNLKIKDKAVTIYSLRRTINASLSKDMLSVDDAIQTSTMAMNTIVDDFYKKKNMFVLTPLARITCSDDQIIGLAEAFGKSPVDMAKGLNICTLRKAHQLNGVTGYYNAEIAAASVLRTSYSAIAKKETKQIAARALKKIANTAGLDGLDQDKVGKYLAGMTSGSGLDEMEIKEMMDKAKNFKMAMLSYAKNAKQARAFKLRTEMREQEENEKAAGTTENNKSKN